MRVLKGSMIVFLVLIIGIITACSNKNEPSNAGKTENTGSGTKAANGEAEKPKELKILYATAEAGSEAVLDAVKKYESETGIKVTVDTFPYNNLQEKVFSELAQKSDYYDLMAIDTPWVPQIIQHLEPIASNIGKTSNPDKLKLDDFIAKAFLDTSVFKLDAPSEQPPAMDTVALDKITGAGFEVVGLPIQSNALTVSYRKDLFEDPKQQEAFKKQFGRDLAVPNTLEEYLDVAKFFTQDTNGDSKTDLYGTTLMAKKHEAAFVDFKSFLSDFGGAIFDKDMKPMFNNEQGVQALELYGSWINKDKVTPPGTTTYTWDEVTTVFASGQVAMGMNYHDMQLDPKVNGKVGYFLFPGKMNGDQIVRGPHFGSWELSVSKYSKNKQAAYDLAEWLTSPDTQAGYLQFNQHVTRLSAYKAAESIEDPIKKEFYQVLGESLKVGVGRPRITTYGQVSEAVQVGMNDFLTGRKGAKEALDGAAKQVDTIMQQEGYYDKK
jgi:multiple sugar transport system substrate-binding protein